MINLNVYLNFMSQTEEAMNFYKSVFGGEFSTKLKFKEVPECTDIAENEKELIMHMSLPIGEHTILMASDTPKSMGFPLNVGNNFSINVTPDSHQEADRIFQGLSAGGKVTMAMHHAFWGSYFGMLTDKFGIQWMLNFEEENKLEE